MRTILIQCGKLLIFHVDRLIDPTRPDAETAKLIEEYQKSLANIFLSVKPSQLNVINQWRREKKRQGPINLKV